MGVGFFHRCRGKAALWKSYSLNRRQTPEAVWAEN